MGQFQENLEQSYYIARPEEEIPKNYCNTLFASSTAEANVLSGITYNFSNLVAGFKHLSTKIDLVYEIIIQMSPQQENVLLVSTRYCK